MSGKPRDRCPSVAYHVSMKLLDLPLRTADGDTVTLGSFHTSEHLLVVFLRHLV